MNCVLRYIFTLCAIAGLGLSGCAKPTGQTAPLLPMIEPQARIDLDDRYVTNAIHDYLALKEAPAFSQYDFIRIDLDQDGWRDALIYLNAPYGQWCNVNGCTVLVLHAQRDGFTLTGELKSVRPPFYTSETRTNGWRDFVIRVSGREDKAKDVVVKFDGEKYAQSPEDLPAIDKNLYPVYTKAFP